MISCFQNKYLKMGIGDWARDIGADRGAGRKGAVFFR